MERKFDLVVIGTGAAGSAAAYKCRKAGWNVAIIDARPFGGTCALRGCDPKKVLVGAAELVDWMNRIEGRGVFEQRPRIDWPSLMQFKKTFTEPVPEKMEKAYLKAGISTFRGRTHFTDGATVQVEDEKLVGQFVLIASGAMPGPLGIPGESYVTTSDRFLELEQLAAKILFIGGGYISFEFAHIASRGGARATILHRGPRPLEAFDADLVAQLVHATNEIGADVHVKTEVKSVEKDETRFVVHSSTDAGSQDFTGDLVVHGAGRVPESTTSNLTKRESTTKRKAWR